MGYMIRFSGRSPKPYKGGEEIGLVPDGIMGCEYFMRYDRSEDKMSLFGLWDLDSATVLDENEFGLARKLFDREAKRQSNIRDDYEWWSVELLGVDTAGVNALAACYREMRANSEYEEASGGAASYLMACARKKYEGRGFSRTVVKLLDLHRGVGYD